MKKNIILVICCIYLTSFIALGVSKHIVVVGLMRTNVIVIDPLGRKTGYDILTGQTYNEIPDSHYSLSGFGDSPNSVKNDDDFYRFIVTNAVDGLYIVKITGTKLGKIQVIFDYDRPFESKLVPPPISYISDVNKVDYFEINYSYATGMAGQIMPITHIASSSTLIDDISVMHKMGYIGNSEFVSEITQKINKIEKERLEPQKPDDKSNKDKNKPKLTPAQKAKKEYTKLLGEITEKYNKPEGDELVKKEAYDVLREDIEYIINHIQ